MTIRTRLVGWYAAILTLSLLLIGIGTYHEMREQAHNEKHGKPVDPPMEEAEELVFLVGLPSVILGLAGGWWLTRSALAPVAALTRSAQRITELNLTEPLPRTRNGDELDKLAEVLNDMNTRLNDSFMRIHEFTLRASHELKTPLTIMCGETETTLRDESLPPQERERLASQLDELRRLARIVDGLTLLAKADAGQVKLAFEPLRLDELVRDNYADAQILAEPKEIRVELAACEEISVRGDRHRLRQLLLNLADNAVKYNRVKGQVTINLRRLDGVAEFSISNTGEGISPEALPHVFDRFFRGDPAHSATEDGCGLGLSIARWIAIAHRGELILKSTPGRETLATLRLPVATG